MNYFLTSLLFLPIIAVGQDTPSTDVEAGLLAVRHEDHDKAVAIFSKVVAQRPQEIRAWFYRGLSRQAIGDQTGALHDMERAMALAPHDDNIRLRRAELYLANASFDAAMTDLLIVIERSPNSPIADHARFDKGQVLVAMGLYEDAFLAYDELVDRRPQDARAYCNRGIVLTDLQEHEKALEDLNTAIELEPELVKAYVTRAIVLFELERPEEACADLLKARELGDPSVDEMLVIYCM